MTILEAFFGIVFAVSMAWNLSRVAEIVEIHRRRRLLARHMELIDRHALMLGDWNNRIRSGMLVSVRAEYAQLWIGDLLHCDDPTPQQLDKAEAMMDRLADEEWLFLN